MNIINFVTEVKRKVLAINEHSPTLVKKTSK